MSRPCSTILRVARLLAFACLFPPLAAGLARAGDAPEDRMADIVRNVRANEELYKNREVIVDYRYALVDPEYFVGGFVKSTRGNYRVVLQDGLSYVKRFLPQPTFNGRNGNANRLQGWDGEVTRAVEQDAYCNLIKGKRNDDYCFYIINPHTLPLWSSPSWLAFPLADYLTGGEAVRSQKAAGKMNVKTAYLGEEIVDGLVCSKVRCVTWREGFDEPSADEGPYHDVWLATERNYIPVLVKVYAEGMGEVPIEVRSSSDFREVEPGIWYPHRFDAVVYDWAEYVENKELVLSCHHAYTVKFVDLHPHYDISLFRDIEFPKGLPVYTIVNGEIVEGENPNEDAATTGDDE